MTHMCILSWQRVKLLHENIRTHAESKERGLIVCFIQTQKWNVAHGDVITVPCLSIVLQLVSGPTLGCLTGDRPPAVSAHKV